MLIDELISRVQAEKDQAEQRLSRARAESLLILEQATTQGRATLTPEEDQRTQDLQATIDQTKIDLQGIEAKMTQLRHAKADDQTDQANAGQTVPTGTRMPAYDQVHRVGREERTYHSGNDRRGAGFVRDVARDFFLRDPQAGARLARHMQEETVERGEQIQRAVGTGAFTGLVVPQYLTDMYAPATAALRPFADVCNHHDLPPDGMTVNISRITTSTGVALQATENTGVQETNADDTLLTENVQTAAGQQTISRQAIERGTGVEEVVLNDLYRRYATTLDSTLLNQSTTGLSAIAAATTYVDASPTVQELWPKLLGANAGVEAALLAQAVPTHAVMHSRRWHWMGSQVGTSWPFMSQPGIATQAGGTNYAQGYDMGVRGMLPNGNKVIVDNNIGTALGAGTEDEIYIIPADECHLWEDPAAPVFIRAEQAAAASLGVLLVLYGYFAYSFRRYTNGMGKISGTGLIAPTF